MVIGRYINIRTNQQLYTFINSVEQFEMTSHQKKTRRSITTHQKSSSTGSKKVFDPELQSFTKRIRRFESSAHHEGSKEEKLTIDRLSEKILQGLQHFYSEDQSGFYAHCRQFLSRGIDSWKQKIVDRMNTYQYMGMAIAHKQFTDIEAEIIKEWKKNYLLFAVMTFWYNSVQKSHFLSLKQFKNKYDTCRDFVAQISYLIFKPWLNNWEKRMERNNIKALDKLFDETSHFIITQSSEFKRVYEKVLSPLIDSQLIGTVINWNYDLNQLATKKCVFDLTLQENLPKTIETLKKFCKQMKLFKKMQLIREYRMSLEMEINEQQEVIQQREGHTKCEVIEKDDYVSALIYCTIKGYLEDLRHSILFLTTLMGDDLPILSKMRIKSYFDDLRVVVDFLTVHKLSQQEEKQLQKLQNLAMHRRMKIVSSPLLENSNDYFEEMEAGKSTILGCENVVDFERSAPRNC